MRVLAILSLILLLGSCVSQEKCYRKFPPTVETKTETTIEYRDTIIQGGSVTQIINRDSLVFIPGEVRRYVDTSGSAMLSFYMNEYGQLVASCQAKDKTIEKLSKRVSEKEVIVKTSQPIREKYVPWWLYAVLGITTVLAIPTALKLVKLVI